MRQLPEEFSGKTCQTIPRPLQQRVIFNMDPTHRKKEVFNPRHMEIFHAVYVSGSESEAAILLGVKQPNIAQTLARAGDVLGFPLFRNVKNRLVPTDEAHVLFRVVDQMQGNLEAARA